MMIVNEDEVPAGRKQINKRENLLVSLHRHQAADLYFVHFCYFRKPHSISERSGQSSPGRRHGQATCAAPAVIDNRCIKIYCQYMF